MTEQPVAELMSTPVTFDEPTPWAQARRRLEQARETYWLATTHADGNPHVRPILAVWADDALHFASGSTTLKTRFLKTSPRVSITVASDDIDVVVEGDAVRVDDEAALQTVADAYASKYEWPVTVRDGAFYDTEGAPTAGPPPYEVYRVTPNKVLGFDADTYGPTRWRF